MLICVEQVVYYVYNKDVELKKTLAESDDICIYV